MLPICTPCLRGKGGNGSENPKATYSLVFILSFVAVLRFENIFAHLKVKRFHTHPDFHFQKLILEHTRVTHIRWSKLILTLIKWLLFCLALERRQNINPKLQHFQIDLSIHG